MQAGTASAANMITVALGNLPERLQRPPPEPGELPNVGDMFGPYLIQAVIGSGGMGVVFRAAQLEPVRRTVALKLMRAIKQALDPHGRMNPGRVV